MSEGRILKSIDHGTRAGAHLHRIRGVPLCEPCKEAERAYQREYRRKVASGEHIPVKQVTARCGTTSGAAVHRRRGEDVCEACKAAERAYKREYNRKIASGEHLPDECAHAPCGTSAGYQRHRRRNEPPCDLCRAANTELKRQYWHDHPEFVERQVARQALEARTPGTPAYIRKRARILRRGAAARGAETSYGVTRRGLQGKLELWGCRCWMCGVELEIATVTWDHVKPLSKGGVDILANIRPACRSCNSRKGAKWPLATFKELLCQTTK